MSETLEMDLLGLNEDLFEKEYTLPINHKEELEGGRVETVDIRVSDTDFYGLRVSKKCRTWDKLNDVLTNNSSADIPELEIITVKFSDVGLTSMDIKTLREFILANDNVVDITFYSIPFGYITAVGEYREINHQRSIVTVTRAGATNAEGRELVGVLHIYIDVVYVKYKSILGG